MFEKPCQPITYGACQLATPVPRLTMARSWHTPRRDGLAFVMVAAWWLGSRETRRLELEAVTNPTIPTTFSPTSGAAPNAAQTQLRRPQFFWPNLILTIVLMASLRQTSWTLAHRLESLSEESASKSQREDGRDG